MRLKLELSPDRTLPMPRPRTLYNRRAANAGVGLIEVLIAVLVMAIGSLGIAALQATALRNSQSALERSQAVVYSYALLDAMRANPDSARTGAYDMTCASTAGTGSLAAADKSRWMESLNKTMGDDACGIVVCNSVDCTITVQWNDSRGTAGAETQKIVTRTRL